MLLTRESRRTRRLVLLAAWAVVTALAGWHTTVVRDYIALLDGIGTTADDATPLRRPCPGSFSDAHTWVRLALAEGAKFEPALAILQSRVESYRAGRPWRD